MSQWKVVTLMSEPPEGSEQAKYLAPNCRYLWEEFFGPSRYEDAKKNQWKWETSCQQRPEDALPERFERRWLRVYTDKINPGRFHVWVLCDPALATHHKADRTSIMALAGLRNQRLAIVDWVLDRLDPAERTMRLIKMADRWEADAILYEETGMQADTFYLDRDVEAYGLNCPIIPVGRKGYRHQMSKDVRIAGLLATFREGRIVLPGVPTPDGPLPRFWYEQKDGKVVDLMAYLIESEYVLWAGKGSLDHDEGLDTLSRIHDPEFQMIYAEDDVADTEADEERSEEQMRRDGGAGQFENMVPTGSVGGWFSRF